MFLKMTKYLLLCSMLSFSMLVACSENFKTNEAEQVVVETELFKNFSDFEIDANAKTITLHSSVDSLVVGSLTTLGGAACYLTLDEDLLDPEIDWNSELVDGYAIQLKGADFVNIAVLDYANRVVAVWRVVCPTIKQEFSSSSEQESSSSAEPVSSGEEASSSSVAESSSSDAQSSSSVEESSSSLAESSSSVEESSSSVEESSSSEAESSSSVEESSSSVEMVPTKVSEISIPGAMVTVEGAKIFIDAPYELDLTKLPLVADGKPFDVTRPVEMELENEDGKIVTYSVVAGTQLPGSDFSARNDFWGTTSDAMAISGSGSYKVPVLGFTVDVSMKSDSANAYFKDGKMTLITQTVIGHSTGFDGGWKMAGGFYFAGSYSGVDGASLYQADNSDAGADNRAADFSQYMTHGKPFTARPTGFEITYSYVHKDNSNDTYPQSSLIYVALVSADNKVIAAGYINDFESVDSETKNVTLTYGSDAGLLSSGFVGTADLKPGNGDEDVASIRVMFASSTLAYVADGGSSSQMKKNFRGAEGAKLIVDDFKLVY